MRSGWCLTASSQYLVTTLLDYFFYNSWFTVITVLPRALFVCWLQCWFNAALHCISHQTTSDQSRATLPAQGQRTRRIQLHTVHGHDVLVRLPVLIQDSAGHA